MKATVGKLTLLICLGASDALSARTPLPDFTGKPLTVVDVPDSYRTLQSDIEQIQQDSPQTYYVVVISNSGAGRWATRDYVDELYGRWQAQADRQNIPLDPNRSVLVLLATENRQLSMHAGSTLQNEYGLRGQRIDREIVQPHFVPHAKAGNYAEGLRVLLAETEKWLNQKEADKRRAAELAAARAATIQRDAKSTVESVKRLIVEARQEIVEKQASGLVLDPFANQASQAEQQLVTLESLVTVNPQESLQQGRQVQQKLRSSIDQIRQLATLQREAQHRLEEVSQHAVGSEQGIDQLRRQNFAVDAFHDELVAATDGLRQARELINSDPQSSLQSLTQVSQQLASIDADVKALPGRHAFRTRTLPLIVLSAVLGLFALIVVFVIVRHLRLKKAVQKRLAEMKQRAVAMSDRYDALKQQHQYLPFSDTDFKEPMQGTTLTVYDEIDENLGKMREHWLSLMEIAQQIDGLVATEWVWSTRRLSRAQQLASEAPTLDVSQLDEQSVALLARLEQAHENAEARLQELQKLGARIVEQLAAIQDANLTVDQYQSELYVVEESIAASQQVLVADPLEAHEQLNQAHQQFERLQQWMGKVLENSRTSAKLQSRLKDVASNSVEHRAAGLKLTEDGGNPDPWLSEARARLEGALVALDQGNVDAAADQLEAARADVERADDVMRRVVSAKAFCETEIPARRSETQRLAGELQRAQEARDALQGSFADESWRNVADNLSQARELLSTLEPTTDRAAESASLEVQHYFRAADTLQTIQTQQQRVAALAAAVEGRLQELNELTEKCRALSDENLEDARHAGQYVQQHDRIVRDDARALLGQAEQAQAQGRQFMEAERVHWPAAWRELETARVALAEALQEATEDVRCHDELTRKLQSATMAVRQVDDLLRSQTADRPRANRQYQAARQSIEHIERQCSAPRADWSLLLTRLTEATDDITAAEQLAKQDIQLARQASDALAAARRLYEQARSYYSHGISAHVGPIASQLDGLQQLLRSQSYEQVIEQAESAARAARAAHDDAVGRARQKQRRMERERRQRASARRASSSTFLSGSSSSSFGSSRSVSTSSSSSFSSGTSSSSFSSGSSQSSW